MSNRPRINSKQERGLQFKADEVDNGIELSVSSNIPYLRDYGYEVLEHTKDSINLERMENGAAVLLDHDPKKQVGVVEKVWLDGTKLRARIRFSRGQLGQEIQQDVLDGIRQNVSIGYAVNQWDKPAKREMIDGNPVYKAVRWTPHEMSIVSIPADFSVGVGRAMEEKELDEEQTTEVLNELAEVVSEVTGEEEVTLETVLDTLVQVTEMVSEMVETSDSTESEIVNEDTETVEETVETESTEEVAVEVAVEEDTNADAAPEEDADRSTNPTSAHIRRINVKENHDMKINQDEVRAANITLTEKEHKQYSVTRAVMNMVEGKRDGFEWEVSQEIAKRSGREASGIFIPTSVRAYAIGEAATAGALTFTQGGEFIDFLRNKAVVASLGASVMSLNSKVALPKASSDLSAQWIAEDGSGATFNSQSFAQVTLSPKKLATYTGFTREALTVGGYDIEGLLRTNIYNSFVTAFDKAAIQGTGLNSQPTGLLSTLGLVSGSASGSALTYANALDLFGLVAGQNADMGNLAYLTTPAIKAKAMSTIKVGSTADFIVSDAQQISMYNVAHSNNVPTGFFIFGDWSSLIMAEFGAIDIVVDPYTSKNKGIIEIGATMLGDVAVKNIQSFAIQKNLTV